MDAIAEKGTIAITTSQENNKLKISIRDTGKGMTEEVKQKILTPFSPLKMLAKAPGSAYLSAMESLENVTGKIEVMSEVGEGTEFVITLPV